MNKKDLLDRCARSGEERVLLARVMDKLELAQNRRSGAHLLPRRARRADDPRQAVGRRPGRL